MRVVKALALFCIVSAAPAWVAADALPDVPVYGPNKVEMYSYAFPPWAGSPQGSTVTTRENGGNRQLIYGLKGDVWSGGGIGVDRLRLKDYVASGALEFYVRGGKGGETADVGFVQAKGLDPADLAYQILIPLANYVHITTAWQKVIIPLKDFPAEGTRWIESENRNAKGAFNWSRVQEFTISRGPGAAEQVQIAFANVAVVGSYDAGKVASARPAKPTGPVLFYTESYAADGGGSYAYPNGQAKLEEVGGGHESRRCLMATMITSAWSGGGIYRAPLDLGGYRDKGVLQAWAKGGKGGEEIYLGLTDKANGASVRLSANTYLPGGLTKDWQRVVIPLKDFPKTGAKWDEASQKNLSFDFDWTKVGEVIFDNNGPDHDNGKVFLDDVEVLPQP